MTPHLPHTKPLSLQATLRRDFAALDRDGNGRLSSAEVEENLLDDRFSSSSAAALGTLYRHRQDLGRRGLEVDEMGKLGEKAEEAFQEKLSSVAKQKDEVFPTDLEEMGNAVQGHISDCWFIAGMQSLKSQRPEEIVEQIKETDNGTFDVSFPDGSKVNVAKPTAAERLAFAQDSEGYLWASVLEKAAGEKSQGFLKESLPQKALTVWSTAPRAIKILTGNPSDTDHLLVTSKDSLRRKLSQTLKDKGLVIGSSKQNLGRRLLGMSPDRDDIVSGHCYSITKFDEKTDTLTLRNPWDDTAWSKAESSENGEFEMPLEQFGQYFSKITYEKRPV